MFMIFVTQTINFHTTITVLLYILAQVNMESKGVYCISKPFSSPIGMEFIVVRDCYSQEKYYKKLFILIS